MGIRTLVPSIATTVKPGDRITIDVPPGRSLPQGHYICRVKLVHSATKYWAQRFTISLLCRSPLVMVSVPAYIPHIPRFEGWLFLVNDQYPVTYTHEPDLYARLLETKNKLSRAIQRLKKRKG